MPISLSIKWIAILLFAGLFLFVLYSYGDTKAKLAKKEYENLSLIQALQSQNKAIDALKLEAQNYQQQRDLIQKQIRTKYQSKPLKDNSAQSQLDAIKEDIRLWYGIEEIKDEL